MKRFFLHLLLMLAVVSIKGQNFTINGYITDEKTGESLIGAAVFEIKSLKGATANVYGFYSLTLPKGSTQIAVSYVGYEKSIIQIDLGSDTSVNFKLKSSNVLAEVEVIAAQSESIEERTQMSTIDIGIEQIKNIPALLGERDVLKAIQLLPGVLSGLEGTSGFYVRGGGPDQNLILLDGVPVYNASHLFGFFSVFNPDAINSVQLIKGGFPARYGGRLSSVLDIRMKEGNKEKIKGEGSIGIVASKFTIEGPIGKKTSFIVSARRTYIDLLARPLIKRFASQDGVEAVVGYYFYDLNAKLNHKINDKNRIYLSTYSGNDMAYSYIKDDYAFDQTSIESEINAELGWGNITGALRWNSILGKRLFMNTTLTYSRYRFEVGQEFKERIITNNSDTTENFAFTYFSGIRDYTAKVDFDFYPNPDHAIKFGGGNIFHRFSPGVNTLTNVGGLVSSIDTSFGTTEIDASEYFLYIEDDWRISPRFKINAGLHFSGFLLKEKNYAALQPRVSARYLISDKLSVKASYATMNQFIHLLTNAGIGLPTDLWVPSTANVKPQFSQQLAVGVAKTIKKVEISVEAYYKTMENLIEYKDGASFFSVLSTWEDQIEFGSGEAYGAELLIQKKVGKTTGWIGYTLSWAIRNFENLNFGNPFFYRYDRRHDVSIVITHKFSEKFDIGATWVYGTGNAVTLPTARYMASSDNLGSGLNNFFGFNGGNVEYIRERNGFRTPSYHRLDLGANFHKEKKWGQTTKSLGFYNAYSRRNPFYLFIENDFQQDRRVLKQISLFPIIPYYSWSFKF